MLLMLWRSIYGDLILRLTFQNLITTACISSMIPMFTDVNIYRIGGTARVFFHAKDFFQSHCLTSYNGSVQFFGGVFYIYFTF
jgi:hypothetical protein